MTWRAARSLLTLHEQLKRGAPRAAPPGTPADAWGLIGDTLHTSTSDHTPHDFPGWGNDIVTAADFPNAPALGLNAHFVLDDIRRDHDSRVKYGISNGQMFSSYAVSGYPAWTWRPYTGSDGHFTHGHLSVVGDARADDTRPWRTIGAPAPAAAPREDDDPMLSITILEAGKVTSQSIPPVKGGGWPRPAALNVQNDTFGATYALRGYAGNEAGVFAPLWGPTDGDRAGIRTFASGQKVAVPLPQGTSCVSLLRVPLEPAAGGEPVPAYDGHLTASVDFGPIGA